MEEQHNLEKKLENWINSEGIPLEYYTSSIYQKERFRVFQSDFILDNGNSREIDVSAFLDFQIDELCTLRLYNIIECKWTKDKPWTIFTSQTTQMAVSARIAQSFGNEIGRTLLWHLAGEENLKRLELFKNMKPNGFSGRQAFSKDNDLFYSSLQSLIAKTIIKLSEYDKYNHKNPFEIITIGIPTIVIDGLLFETIFNFETEKVELNKVNYSRVQWKGSSLTKYISVVDIVTKEYLPEYVRKIKNDFQEISKQSIGNIKNLREFYDTKNLDILKFKTGPRGFTGYPKFIIDQIGRPKEKQLGSL
ncbi:MAG: hypothetical protein IPH02_00435 [Sphingobacteriales bacterium]|nr:hypothetical protein [Sphingobacteriales bacterium]